ncbi:MAG: cytochrome c [Verrucomicrobiota bacterium]
MLTQDGGLLYVKNCSPCHQNTGLGQPPMYPPLAGSDWVNAPGPDRLIRIVLHGLHGPITVKDATFNNIMVPWKDFLKDEEIAALLTYLRRNQSWGNTAPAVTPARVTEIRQAETGRDGPWTAEELLKIPADKP